MQTKSNSSARGKAGTRQVAQSENSPFDKIEIRGAKEHNLKNIDLDIPRGKIVAFTGRSGSGKSSLAFDTVYAEGYRK